MQVPTPESWSSLAAASISVGADVRAERSVRGVVRALDRSRSPWPRSACVRHVAVGERAKLESKATRSARINEAVNVVFLSPNFPPHYYLFCAALRARGITVLGVGDAPYHDLGPELRAALSEYVSVRRLDEYELPYRAVASLASRHGRIDRVDSLNEHWLPLEARLREDFNIPMGARPKELAHARSKSGMAEIFAAAKIPHPNTARVTTAESVRAFVKENGLPVVFKPDVGVGAADTFSVATQAELEAVLATPPTDSVVQPFIPGTVTTYDGFADREGRVVFALSFVYSSGVMSILNEQLDVFYYSRREIPPALEALGKRAVAAFPVRERFFHFELFERDDGTFSALEMNLRPPGGFTTDLMNYACDVDVYSLWARSIAGENLAETFQYETKFFCAHVSRRSQNQYRVPHETLIRELGPMLVLWREIPSAFANAMGNVIYIVRSKSLPELESAFELVHARA
jgi:hypothetical protein